MRRALRDQVAHVAAGGDSRRESTRGSSGHFRRAVLARRVCPGLGSPDTVVKKRSCHGGLCERELVLACLGRGAVVVGYDASTGSSLGIGYV